MKVVFLGSSSYVVPVIEELKRKFEIEFVVTTEKENGTVPKFCVDSGLPYLSTQNFSNSEFNSKFLTINSDVAILADFGLILPSSILNKFKYGILNIHPSLLPKYRGPTPVQNAILSNERETGVSVIKLDEKMDHGPVLAQETIGIRSDETSEDLYRKLFPLGARLVADNLEKYISGELKTVPQDHSKATYTKLLKREDGFFDLDNPPSIEKLNLMTRAYFPWPGAWCNCRIQNSEFRIVKFLPGKRIQVEGKKPVSYKDFINGYPDIDKKLLELLKN